MDALLKDLLNKYDVPGPRYTSYPTVPYWEHEPLSIDSWISRLKQTFAESNKGEGLSLYIHLPFCERLCTFCGCNKRITVNHGVELPYIRTVLKEWDMYLQIFGDTPLIGELHLGGGTPTFFSPENLKLLIEEILSTVKCAEGFEFGFEAHPNVTTREHLQTLYDLGFRRVSFGIQDFNEEIQRIINRHQTYEKVVEVTEVARETGYTSINYDFVYGLPLQTLSCIEENVRGVEELKPERIAFYSYAHVPWVSPAQRRYTEDDLPRGVEKLRLYQRGKDLFEQAGYFHIGMDHFALPGDDLYEAAVNKRMHRNFMGYTPKFTPLLIGLGVSSISDAWLAFAQNIKKLEEYTAAVEAGSLPIFRGHLLTDEDEVLRRHILNIMCHFETDWSDESMQHPALFEGLQRMEEMEKDGLVRIDTHRLTVTEPGKTFVRNICMALDARLWRNQPKTRLFSQVI